MNAAYNPKITEGKFNVNHRKEKYFVYQFTGVTLGDGKIKEPVILRIYGTDSRCYACLWTYGNGIYKSGSAYAGGYGYHRGSAAAAYAIENAGYILSEDIAGRGTEAIREAVKAIVRLIYPGAELVDVLEAYA